MLTERLKTGVIAAVLLLGSLQVLYLAIPIGVADVLSVRAEWERNHWSSLPRHISQQEVDKVQDAYRVALAWRPGDGQLHWALGHTYSVQAAYLSSSPISRYQALQQTLASFRAAVQSRPMHAHAWLGIAYTLAQLNELGPEFWQAYDQAFRYGWREPALRPQLAELGFLHWKAAGLERQTQLDQMIATLTGWQRKELLDVAIQRGRYHLLTTR